MDFGGRNVVFKALVGSHNYNLNTSDSDKDYKLFVFPTLDDLYFNKSFNITKIGEDVDYDVHDIRKCANLWYKSNVNFLEVLFTEEFSFGPFMSDKNKELINELLNMKNDIARMNLKYLYDACIGMYYTKTKYLEKGTEGTQHLVEKYGYDTKQALHAQRILDFLERFYFTRFSDFKKSIWYDDDDPMRVELLDIKNGKYTLEEYKSISNTKLNHITTNYGHIYRSIFTNEDTNSRVISILKELVRINI